MSGVESGGSLETMRLRRRVLELVCSSAWLEVCLEVLRQAGESSGARSGKILDRAAVYPPGGRRRTCMVHCRSCGKRWYPPNYVAMERCLDCLAGDGVAITDERTHVSSTSSPTAVALREMEMRRVRLIEMRLPAEDEATLRRQIAEYRPSEIEKTQIAAR
jgi:hypothetical protein